MIKSSYHYIIKQRENQFSPSCYWQNRQLKNIRRSQKSAASWRGIRLVTQQSCGIWPLRHSSNGCFASAWLVASRN